MYVLPDETLQKLKCNICDGYLNNGPVMLSDDSNQICGRCFMLLPTEETVNYRHQSGLEAMAELFCFPCRYNLQGCTATFPFNRSDEHEMRCPFKYAVPQPDLVPCPPYGNLQQLAPSAPPIAVTRPSHSDRLYSNNGELEMLVRCHMEQTKRGAEDLKVKVEVQGYGDNKLAFGDKNTNNRITIEGNVLLKSVPKIDYFDITSHQVDPLKDATTSYGFVQDFCCGCKLFIRSDIFTCINGHKLCEACKRSTGCRVCVNMTGELFCPNHSKGCDVISTKAELEKHIHDCEFNDFHCLVDGCTFKSPLAVLKRHALEVHQSEIIQANSFEDTVTKKDRVWYLYCYDKLFKCLYNYYPTHVEVLLVYVGPNDSAFDYQYDVILSPDPEKRNGVKKRAKCIGWNGMSLESGVQIDIGQIKEMMTCRVFKFEIVVHIIDNIH